MPSKGRHVVPRGKDWAVVKPGSSRASAVVPTQREAERAAKRMVANEGGGEVRIHGRDNKIRDSDTVSPGHDPHPPTDKKH